MYKKQQAIFAIGLAVVLGVGAVGCSSSAASSSAASSSASSSSSAAVSSSSSASSTAATYNVDKDGMYVSADWLMKNLDDVVVVDARSASSYGANHIAGAVNLTWQGLSNVVDVKQGEAGWAELDDAATIAEAAAAVGIDGTKPVIVYTDVADGWGEDGRIMWTLREAGIEDVKVLDGGWRKWVGKKGDTEDGSIVNGTPVTAVTPADEDPIDEVDTAYVKEHLDDAVIVDARLTAEYEGEKVMGESRMGRIPGAVSVPNASLFNQDSTIKSEEELADIFADAGLTDKDALVITYCTGGVRGANVAEILADHGFTNVKVYTAGFSEWAGDSSNEVEAEAEVPASSKAA